MNLLATYVHNLDPVLLEVPGTAIAVRWYGLAYLMGFLLGFLLLRSLSSKKLYCVESDKLGDFITLVCLFGVVCGGRLGEFFFYWLPQHGFSGFMEDPTWVFRVWEGGMASHGGIIGVALVALLLVAELVLVRKLEQGNGKLGKYQIFPAKPEAALTYVSAGLTAVALVVALALGATAAYYAFFTLVAWLFCMAVYYTVRLM